LGVGEGFPVDFHISSRLADSRPVAVIRNPTTVKVITRNSCFPTPERGIFLRIPGTPIVLL
jgi:hypothetical protein